jgi:hypothetical protein
VRKGKVIRLIALAAIVAPLFVMVTASPAAARPYDCSLRVTINRVGAGMSGTGYVSCPGREHYAIDVDVYREEAFDSLVAHAYKGFYDSGNSLTALEPCSDVQTSKTYHARAKLFDTRFGPPIEVKDAKSSSVRGHC